MKKESEIIARLLAQKDKYTGYEDARNAVVIVLSALRNAGW